MPLYRLFSDLRLKSEDLATTVADICDLSRKISRLKSQGGKQPSCTYKPPVFYTLCAPPLCQSVDSLASYPL